MASWAEYKWSMKLQEYSSRLHGCISEISTSPPGMHFPRCASMKLNRLRTGVGLFRSTKHKWGMTLSAACECGAVEQAADHVITFCPTYRHPCGNRGMTTMDENLVSWLTNTCSGLGGIFNIIISFLAKCLPVID